MVVNWVWAVVPSLGHVLSELNSRNRLKFGVLLMRQ